MSKVEENKVRRVKKAKEYADYVLKNSNTNLKTKEMSKVLGDIVLEIEVLIKARNIKRSSSLRAIIFELEKKWKAVCRRVDLEYLNPCFMQYLEKELPDLLQYANIPFKKEA